MFRKPIIQALSGEKHTPLGGLNVQFVKLKRGYLGTPTSDRAVGIKACSEKDINKWCPDSLVVISSAPKAPSFSPTVLLDSLLIQGHQPFMGRQHLYFTLCRTCSEFSKLSGGHILAGGLWGSGILLPFWKGLGKNDFLAANT